MSVVAPAGFRAAAVAAGIKPAGSLDVALVCTVDARPVSAAAVFTSNLAAAAPVTVSREHLAASAGVATGVVLTSGNANAATGRAGIDAARTICREVAERLSVEEIHLLVCQTGLIGVPFPVHVVADAAEHLVGDLGDAAAAGGRAAKAIMTTDTVRKEALVAADGFTVGGMAKGAAMLAPDMATMLAVLTTDAACDPGSLRDLSARPRARRSTHSVWTAARRPTTRWSSWPAAGPAGSRPTSWAWRCRRPPPSWPGRWRRTPRVPRWWPGSA